jgi:uncharacterized RDD family membrane protein YckC
VSQDPGVFDRDFDNPYEAPKASKPPGPPSFSTGQRYTGYAGFWVRLLALIIDNIILGIGGFAVMMLAGVAIAAISNNDPENPVVLAIVLLLYLLVIIGQFAYFALLESSTSQATLGKMAMGLKVTDVYGRRLSFGQAMGRTLGKILSGLILYIGFLMAAFDDRKQGLHDKIASTLVMKTR